MMIPGELIVRDAAVQIINGCMRDAGLWAPYAAMDLGSYWYLEFIDDVMSIDMAQGTEAALEWARTEIKNNFTKSVTGG